MSTKTTNNTIYLGIDAGGTFTDFLLVTENGSTQTHKVLSTPKNPALAILQGVKELGLEHHLDAGNLKIIHGSTVATNAALEGKGARTAYVTNKGFKDILTIGRQARKELYNLKPIVTQPPVPRELCFEVDCRRDAKGNVLKELSDTDIEALVAAIKAANVDAIAINILFSFINPKEEVRLEKALKEIAFVSRSSYVLPVYKEYERGIATWLNASLGPKVGNYLNTLHKELKGCDISIMQSSGGLLNIDDAKHRAVNLLLSGPAGGLSAVKLLGHALNQTKLLSFDMGGTSTDVSLMDEDFKLSDESKIADWPVAVPMLDMATIGAGGGSIAWIDEAGMLHVGPESSGSDPGPACYGRGGQKATVTDANLVLGHLQKNARLGGSLALDFHAASNAVKHLGDQLGLSLEDTAKGIIELAEQQMISALHNISVKQGYAPSEFNLCCFGGAGGMHVCSLAEKLEMQQAIIPQNAGVLSAFGMLTAPPQRNATKSYITPFNDISDSELDEAFENLLSGIADSNPELVTNGEITRHLDLRYLGQSYTIEVPFDESSPDHFIKAHKKRYGHTLNKELELVNLKISVSGKANIQHWPEAKENDQSYTKDRHSIDNENALYKRESLQIGETISGPAIITESVSTTWLPIGWTCSADKYGNLILTRC